MTMRPDSGDDVTHTVPPFSSLDILNRGLYTFVYSYKTTKVHNPIIYRRNSCNSCNKWLYKSFLSYLALFISLAVLCLFCVSSLIL